MSGFSDYQALYGMLSDDYQERLQKAEREGWIRRIAAERRAASGEWRPSATLRAVCWVFALLTLHSY